MRVLRYARIGKGQPWPVPQGAELVGIEPVTDSSAQRGTLDVWWIATD
jgi:hypothetical protein